MKGSRTKSRLYEKLVNLIDVKSIITFAITAVFVFCAIKGEIPTDELVKIFLLVISFYFGTQHKKLEKSTDTENKEEEDV